MAATRIVVLVLALAAPDVAMAASAAPLDARLPASAIPYSPAETLVANVENAVRTIVPANHDNGVSQILDLIGRTDSEEQWVFIPSAALWIEIGRNEFATELDSQVEIDTDYLTEIVRLFHIVNIVHFHPAGYYWPEGAHPVQFPVSALGAEELQPVGFALPSPDDVVSSIELSRLLQSADPDARITYSVVSPHGVVTYGPTEPGLRTILYEWGNPRATIARSIVTRIAIRRMEFNIASTIGRLSAPSIGDVIAALCAQATDENYELSYRPF